jgi:hypothetical protein
LGDRHVLGGIVCSLATVGLRAEYAKTVDPSLTVPSQYSISSGSSLARTGIVSDIYHNSKDNFYWYRRGFDEVMDEAEPVRVIASRSGLTMGALFLWTGAARTNKADGVGMAHVKSGSPSSLDLSCSRSYDCGFDGI